MGIKNNNSLAGTRGIDTASGIKPAKTRTIENHLGGAFEGAIFGRACPSKARTNALAALHPCDNTRQSGADASPPAAADAAAQLYAVSRRVFAGFRP